MIRHCTQIGVVALFGLTLAGCGTVEVLLEPLRGETPHERYFEALERAGLADAALAREWVEASEDALRNAVEMLPPADESGWIPSAEPIALGYRVELRRGQRLQVELELGSERSGQVFLEVFRVLEDAPEFRTIPVAWIESTTRSVVHEARATATYIVRMQPELLIGGGYRVQFRVGASLAFPVEGSGVGSIQSVFGDDREGGRRVHHGVDIFAPRGTPVLAVSSGTVTRVSETPVGGRVVWVRDELRNHNQYYAHLDRQFVERGARVGAGDTLGFVGNTGNAVTTPPHLHFGIYARGEGPVDPYPFLDEPTTRPSALAVLPERFHSAGRVSSQATSIHAGPSSRSAVVVDAEPHLPVHILAGIGPWLRVRLPDGRQGFVQEGEVEVPSASLGTVRVANLAQVRLRPESEAPGLGLDGTAGEMSLLGRFSDWLWVQGEDGSPRGWILSSEALGVE